MIEICLKFIFHNIFLLFFNSRGGDPYKCDICKKTFTVKMGLRSHLNTVHSEERRFSCHNCDFKAKSIVILNRHVERVHKNNLKHLCSHCGKKFFRAYDLRCHIHRVHKDVQGMFTFR